MGLTPDEELELAMLKSRVAEEEPDESPRAPPAYQSNYSGQATAARAPAYAPGGVLNPSAPLVMALPSLVPLRGAARGPARGPARGSTPALIEGLLGSDHLGDAPLAPLVASHARPRPQDHPGLAPPAPPAVAAAATAGAAYQPPAAMPAMAVAAVGEEEWDDVDRPLSGLFGGGGGGNCGGGGGSGGYVDSGGGGISGGGYGKLD